MGGTAIYARESKDKAGDGHNVADQIATGQSCAVARCGGEVPAAFVFTDNDISAYSGKIRPDYLRLLEAIRRGVVSTVIVFHTSRLWRNRRERAEGIEIMKAHAVNVIAVRGPSLDMSTAYGRGMAGLLGEFDTMESEVKSERQQHANAHRAAEGKRWRSSQRPFGWSEEDYAVPVPAEADAIREGCALIIAGGTVSGIVRTWTAMGVAPAQGDK
ncbi:MAG TPA: recombinase family protein, partial [Streptosporangiaceae bacterium]|nr:recombinase family protein [Streptosporangiaceae bacterium]